MEQDNEFFLSKNQRQNNLANRGKYFDKNKKKYHTNSYKYKDNSTNDSLINVYLDTQKYFEKVIVNNPVVKPFLYDIELVELPNNNLRPTYNTIYQVENIDTLDMAITFINDGFPSPLILNMASEFKAGGGVASGKTAQEECLFRRTNAFQTHPKHWYPLGPNDIIYSPKIQIIKDSNNKMLDKEIIDRAQISMIAVAALRKPRLSNGSYFDSDRELMFKKIESIFKIAILNNHTSLVLGALGCGVFKNPPTDVVKIYKQCTDLYGKYFKKIGFAILIVKESDNENFNLFKKMYS